MTFDEWSEHYSPIPNPEGESGFCVDGVCTLFETYDDDLRKVEDALARSPGTVWTVIEGEDEKLYVVDGLRRVNRIGFFITKRSYKGEGVSILVD